MKAVKHFQSMENLNALYPKLSSLLCHLCHCIGKYSAWEDILVFLSGFNGMKEGMRVFLSFVVWLETIM